jgi:hypothetical protein
VAIELSGDGLAADSQRKKSRFLTVLSARFGMTSLFGVFNV